MIEKIVTAVLFGFLILLFFIGGILAILNTISDYLILFLPCLIVPIIVFIIWFISFIQLHNIKKVERRFKATLLNPDRNGLYPVPTDIKLVPYVQPVFDIAHTFHSNRQPHVPHSFTYAPRTSSTGLLEDKADKELTQLALPSFSSLPFIDGKILLGYTLDNVPKHVERTELISTLVGGQTDSGKSTLMRLILSQYLQQGCQIAIIDPHYNAGKDSLGKSFENSNSLYLPTVYEPGEIKSTLAQFDLEINERLKGKEDRTPLILIIDEFSGLLSRDENRDQIIHTVNKISSESRKVGIYCYCIAQQFHKDLIPSVLRNGFTTFLSTKSRYDVAHLLSGSKIFAKEVEKINGYQCVYLSKFGALDRLNVPNTSASDIETVTGVDSRSISRSTSRSSHDQLVISHLKLGDSINKIVSDVYGITNKGRSHLDACRDVYRIIGENIE